MAMHFSYDTFEFQLNQLEGDDLLLSGGLGADHRRVMTGDQDRSWYDTEERGEEGGANRGKKRTINFLAVTLIAVQRVLTSRDGLTKCARGHR